jgi:hypothetical protein
MMPASNLLLLAGTALLVIWSLTGGPAQLQWWRLVHQAASSGWDMRQAYGEQTMKPRFWLPVCLFSGALLVFLEAAVRLRDPFRVLRNIKHG